jgi:hypothetical protein
MLSDYLAGFLICDGALNKNGCTVSLQIQDCDVLVLDLFAEETQKIGLKSTRDQRTIKDKLYTRERCHSRGFYRSLLRRFGGRLKSDRKWPSQASIRFLCGVWDADGHFQARRNSIEGEISHSSYEWMNDLAAFITSASGIETRKLENREGCWRLGISASICNWFRDCVYTSPPFLTRKRDALIDYHQPGPRKRWQSWQVDYLTEHFKPGTDSWNKIAAQIGKSPKAVSKKVWQLGLASNDE